jgi:2-amino-4-hydroxy-6-hydroxymethyldihydropteridine diphosphokinase
MQALIALGGNLNFGAQSPAQVLVQAIGAIAARGLPVLAQSRLYSTPAFPLGSGPRYVNAALAVQVGPAHSPESLYAWLSGVEAAFGRTRAQRWGGRTLDLDLLAIGGQIHPDLDGFHAWANLDRARQAQIAPAQMILPHPRLHERAFVLVPLLEIAADWRHPVYHTTVREMLAALPAADIAEVTPV